MKPHLAYLCAFSLIVAGNACGRSPDPGPEQSSESGESGESGESSASGESGASSASSESGASGESGGSSESGESGGPVSVPCEGRAQADCFGLVTEGDEYGDSCVWTELTPLTDAGNSCALGAPEGRCLPIAPVLDGCGGAPELMCTIGDTTEYGTAAVKEFDGQLYILAFGFDCWPPGSMQICEGSDPDPLGCECACDLILGG